VLPLGRIGFTLAALLVYLFGAYLPLPGLGPTALAWTLHQETGGGGVAALLPLLSGGGMHARAIFALEIFPYLTAGRLIQIVLILSLVLLYTAAVLGPPGAAGAQDRIGGRVPGIRPEDTRAYIRYVLGRITVLGGLYVATICLVPEFLLEKFEIPFFVRGTSILVVGCAIMDIDTQIRQEKLRKAGG
jgi:preprotein translocase subunit SecY